MEIYTLDVYKTTESLVIKGFSANQNLLRHNLGFQNCIKDGKNIDPPYNTGNDFVYEDDFAQDTNEYLANSGQYDEEGNRLVQNTESNGRFHTDWLNMIYPRLKLAKDLLTDDGVIFISIDDNEISNLTRICNEIFGRKNYAGTIIVRSNPRGSQSTKTLAELHEYLLVYTKNIELAAIVGHALTNEMLSEYKYSEYGKKYRLLGLRQRGGFWRRSERPNLYFPIYINPHDCSISVEKTATHTVEILPVKPSTNEDGTWRWSKVKVKTESNLLVAKKIARSGIKTWDIFQKDFLSTAKNILKRTKAKSIWDEKEVNYQNGTVELKELLVNAVFDYAKPVYLIKRVLEMIGIGNGEIFLDFFSGSATTAHAVMQLNAEDGGNRKFIMVQLPEETDEKSEAFKAGYKNICEIGKERIRRAGKKILEEHTEASGKLDIGFRVLKVDSTNMQDVYYTPTEYSQSKLFDLEDNIKPDRTPEDLLFQVMLDLGVLLSSKIEEIIIGGKKVFNVAEGYLMACFDNNVTSEVVTEIAKKQPYYAVFRDSGIASDSVATNFEQVFETYSPTTVRKVL